LLSADGGNALQKILYQSRLAGRSKMGFMRRIQNMSTKHFRAALYARVSTADQQTIPLQIGAMQDYAQRRGWTVTTEVRDVNGGAKLRPKREELLKLARQRKLDVIIVWRLDRCGRSLHDVLQ